MDRSGGLTPTSRPAAPFFCRWSPTPSANPERFEEALADWSCRDEGKYDDMQRRHLEVISGLSTSPAHWMMEQRTVYVGGRSIPVPAFFKHVIAISRFLVVHDFCALGICRGVAWTPLAFHAMRGSSALRMPRPTWPLSTPVIRVTFLETPSQRLTVFAQRKLCTWRETFPPLSRRGWNGPSALRHVRDAMLPVLHHFRSRSSSPRFGPSLMNSHRISFSPPYIATQLQPQLQPEPQPQPASVPCSRILRPGRTGPRPQPCPIPLRRPSRDPAAIRARAMAP